MRIFANSYTDSKKIAALTNGLVSSGCVNSDKTEKEIHDLLANKGVEYCIERSPTKEERIMETENKYKQP